MAADQHLDHPNAIPLTEDNDNTEVVNKRQIERGCELPDEVLAAWN